MEKDIEILESFIKQLEEFEDEEELKQAIENLINRVKELENTDLTIVYLDGVYDREKKWKDKIKEKIEEYKELDKKEFAKQGNFDVEIGVLQELLEEQEDK